MVANRKSTLVQAPSGGGWVGVEMCQARSLPGMLETLKRVTRTTRDPDEERRIQERFHKEGGAGMMGKILQGSREQNWILQE